MRDRVVKNEKYYNYTVLYELFEKNQINPNRRKYIEKLYTSIKKSYIQQIKDGSLNITFEKIRLEKELGKYYSVANDKEKYYLANIKLLLTAIGSSYLTLLSQGLKVNPIYIGFGAIIIIAISIYFIVNEMQKSKHYEKDFVNSLSLKVLKEIEENKNK